MRHHMDKDLIKGVKVYGLSQQVKAPPHGQYKRSQEGDTNGETI